MNLETPIAHIMVTDPITVDVDQTISDVCRALSSERFHHLPVLDDGRLVGMISVTDLLKHGLAGADAETTGVYDRHMRITKLMDANVITLSHRATIGEAAKLLSAGGFHAVPVIDEAERLRGLVTSTDLIGFMLEAPPARTIRPDVESRLKTLERVLKAAELYLHSGLAESEHTRLERAIEAAR
jgi:CBS domain-containing protein